MIEHTIRLSDHLYSILTLDAPKDAQTDRYVHSLKCSQEDTPRRNGVIVSYDHGKTFIHIGSGIGFEIEVDPRSYPEAEMIGFVHRSLMNYTTL